MTKVTAFTVIIAILTGMFCCMVTVGASADVTMLFVDTNGNDDGNGEKNNPFKTVQRAVDAAENISGIVIINLREGNYAAETINLDNNNNDLIIRAYPGEKVVLSGGVKIKLSSLKDITDESVKNRFVEQTAVENIKTINLKTDCGVTDVGGLEPQGYNVGNGGGYSSALSYKDKYLPVSGYPNDGFLKISEDVTERLTDSPLSGTSGITNYYPFGASLQEMDGSTFNRYTHWEKTEDLWTTGYVSETWADATTPTAIDFLSGTVTLYSDNRLLGGGRVKFINLLEEIDSPGEWFLNKDTGDLYVYPPKDMTDNDEFYFNSCNERFINISGSSDVTISGIRFTGTRNNAISANGASGIFFHCLQMVKFIKLL